MEHVRKESTVMTSVVSMVSMVSMMTTVMTISMVAVTMMTIVMMSISVMSMMMAVISMNNNGRGLLIDWDLNGNRHSNWNLLNHGLLIVNRLRGWCLVVCRCLHLRIVLRWRGHRLLLLLRVRLLLWCKVLRLHSIKVVALGLLLPGVLILLHFNYYNIIV